jgi:predicted component of type VI protein secretion system
MTLVLQGIALNDEPMSQPLIGRFDERGGTLGRSESATFTLPDPQRLISRLQAQILFQDEGYWIESVSAANSTLHNGRPLSAGMRILLRDGDELRIGGYTLVVAFENDEVSASILRGRTLIIQPPRPLIAPTAAPAAAQNPWSPAESLRSSQAHAASSVMPDSAPTPAIPVGAPADVQPSGKPAGAQKPVDHEPSWSERTVIRPLTDPNTVPAAAQKPSSPAESLRSSQASAASSVMPNDATKPAVPMCAPADGQPHTEPAGAQKRVSDESRWSEPTLMMQRPGPLTVPRVGPAAEQKLLSPAEALLSSQPPATSSVTPHNAATPAVHGGANWQPSAKPGGAQKVLSDDPLWRAFLEGVGIELPNGLSPEFMRLVGTLLRIAIEGTHRLVTMRATAKEEIRADMTRIQPQGNNPLKFAPDGTAALQFLLQSPVRGFLAGPSALQETMIDLQSHQVAMTAGMLSAVEAVLDGFDPSKVEALLTTWSVLDSFRPTHRRARLWELYVEHYRSLREDAQEVFKRVCAEAFRKAYEEAQGRSTDAAHAGSMPPEPKP